MDIQCVKDDEKEQTTVQLFFYKVNIGIGYMYSCREMVYQNKLWRDYIYIVTIALTIQVSSRNCQKSFKNSPAVPVSHCMEFPNRGVGK